MRFVGGKMITTPEAIRTLEALRSDPNTTTADRALATELEAIIWQAIREERRFDELGAVSHGISRTVDRLKYELIEDHNKDIDAIAASLAAMDDLVVSMRRAL